MFNDTDLPHQSEVDGPDAGVETGDLQGASAPPPRFGRLSLCVAAASALAFGVVGTVAYGVWFNHDQQAYADAIAGARQALGKPSSAMAGTVVAKSAASTRPAMPTAAPGTSPVAAAATAATPAPPVAAATLSAPARAAPGGVHATGSPATAKALTSEGEEGGKLAVWSGQIARAPAAAIPQTSLAHAAPATPAAPAPSSPSNRRATNAPNPVAQQAAADHPGRDARIAQQERRAAAANARNKGSLFARMGLFFRRVSYRQHGRGSHQDIYSHP